MRFLFLILLLLLSSPALAQEDMTHPKTGEAGAWIPRWLQKDHLKLELDLKSCELEKDNQAERLEKKDEQLQSQSNALEEEKKASGALTEVLTTSELELQEEKEHNDTLTAWLWGTSSAAVVATTVLILVVAL